MSDRRQPGQLPIGLVIDDKPPFVPRMVMTPQLNAVVKNVVSQWRHREKFAELLKFGIRPLDRLLFYGPPGNGKTLTCYWMARELQIPLYLVQCNQLRAAHLGETVSNVADVVTFLNHDTQPAICLWDEIESIFIDRSVASQSCDREIGAALTVFLQALDRWRAPTLLVMATNLPDQLDPALKSRVEMRLEFSGPTPEQVQQLIEYWSELLCKQGADEWVPELRDQMEQHPPISFRELQQAIAWRARDWVANQVIQ